MFNIGISELILILLVAFVIVGPQDLPKVARALGRGVRTLQSLMKQLKQETGFSELEKEFKGVKSDLSALDPGKDLKELEKSLDREADQMKKDLSGLEQDVKKQADDLQKTFGTLETDLKSSKKPQKETI